MNDTTHNTVPPFQQPPQLISVVMPCYNGAKTLPAQLEALASQTFQGGWELVLVDNRSTDGSADLARRWADRLPLRVVEAAERQGINYARNAGAAAARGDYIIFCDVDDVAREGWLQAMAQAAARCALIGGALDEAALNDETTRAWRPPTSQQTLPVALDFLPFAVGANCGVRADVLDALEGFDESYVRGGADVEFFWRAQLAGHDLCHVPDAVMEYRHRPGLRTLRRQFYRYGRAEPQLYAAFRGDGLGRPSLKTALVDWAWIAFHCIDWFRAEEKRGKWLHHAAYRWGRLMGSLRFRVLFL
ncbi:MAG: glycosyltransferase [Acidimicrobiia bacterium]